LFPTSVVCALTVACTVLAACDSNSDIPVQSLGQIARRTAPPQKQQELAPLPEPSSYRIEFARYIAGNDKPTHFVRSVVRPFNETGAVNRTLGFVREPGGGKSRVTLVRPIPDDARPHLYPPRIEATPRRVAGRICMSYRFAEEELCVDAAGLVLMARDASVLEVATKVTVGAKTKTAEELTASLVRGFTDSTRGSIRPIDPDSAPPGTDYSLDAPPDGFALVGRYAVAPLTAEVLKRTSRKVIGNIVDVYVRGVDSLVVERGGKLDLTAVGDEDLGSLGEEKDVDLGQFGTGKVGIGGSGPFGYREVRAFPVKGRYVVVAGTLPEDELVSLMRSLHEWPGTQIHYLDH
jgi:hypothetical protein